MRLTPSGKVVDAKMGVCPKCGSTNLDYENFEIFDDDTGYFPVTCKDCFTYFEETYRLQFVSQDNVEVPTFSD